LRFIVNFVNTEY